VSAAILPPPPVQRPPLPTPPYAQRRWWPIPPRREEHPEQPPPPVLDEDCDEDDAELAAWADAQRDVAFEHQDADPDAEWADLEPWMHHAIGFDGCPLEQGFGAGESVGGRLLWWSQIAGQA